MSGENETRAGKAKARQTRLEKDMERNEVEKLRKSVGCAAVLEKAGFAIDVKESTRRAVKYRRGDAIVIVIHEGRGWFDPLSDAKGDVYALVAHLDGVGFTECLERVADLVGFVPTEPVWTRNTRDHDADLAVAERWHRRHKPRLGSSTWRYLRDERRLPDAVLRIAIRHDLLREGPRGSMWAAHRDGEGVVTGWEERGPEWRGFSTGGAKVLFRFGKVDALRLCVTEAAIDAMSLAAIERVRPDSVYLSTGGGWSPATDRAVRALVSRPGARLIAATDNNPQGERYADRLEAAASAADCSFERLRPEGVDWNADLKAQRGKDGKAREEGSPVAACPPAASRVELRPLRGP